MQINLDKPLLSTWTKRLAKALEDRGYAAPGNQALMAAIAEMLDQPNLQTLTALLKAEGETGQPAATSGSNGERLQRMEAALRQIIADSPEEEPDLPEFNDTEEAEDYGYRLARWEAGKIARYGIDLDPQRQNWCVSFVWTDPAQSVETGGLMTQAEALRLERILEVMAEESGELDDVQVFVENARVPHHHDTFGLIEEMHRILESCGGLTRESYEDDGREHPVFAWLKELLAEASSPEANSERRCYKVAWSWSDPVHTFETSGLLSIAEAQRLMSILTEIGDFTEEIEDIHVVTTPQERPANLRLEDLLDDLYIALNSSVISEIYKSAGRRLPLLDWVFEVKTGS